MYSYELSNIQINGNNHHFDHNIREVIKYKDTYIVLLEIPVSSDEINNIFCLDENANIKWQSEDLSKKYPKLINLAYLRMGIIDDIVYATDFFGRNYRIDPSSGKILGCKIVK